MYYKMNELIICCNTIAFLFGMFVTYIIYGQVKEHYTYDEPKLNEIRNIFKTFFSKKRHWEYPLDMLNKKNIMGKIILYRGNKSFTINKKDTFICLKDTNGSYYKNNMLIYVTAHEISHSLTDEVGHTKKFYRIYDALLKELERDGIYDPNIPINENYCTNGDPEIKKSRLNI